MEESKIIVYTTSFSGVRRAHEDCKYILGIFHNHRVKVEERDVWASQNYLRELEERLKGTDFTLPQVFINGQHIGVNTACIHVDLHVLVVWYNFERIMQITANNNDNNYLPSIWILLP